MTSLAEEKEAQKRWQLLPRHSKLTWFDRLVEKEFLPPDEIAAAQAQQLANVLQFAVRHVPFYRERMKLPGWAPERLPGPADLERLPILSRADLQDNFDRLQPPDTPPGHRAAVRARTSGSTGQRVVVVHAEASVLMLNILKQRESRWFRYEPTAMLAVVRHPSDLPRAPDGALLRDGETSLRPAWRYVGIFFRTGPYLCFNDTNPIDRQLEWLDRHRPAYLTALSSHLEHLALSRDGAAPERHLDGVLSIAQQLTPAMEHRIQRAFGCTVDVNYGLNEIGIVATRCPEGGRYHVHSEHCLVEIVDDEGAPVKPGEAGRLLVTALHNLAMPLIRYDTGDIAEAVAQPCPCGRTLPAFAGIRGRYRRMAFLPAGTWNLWVAFQQALSESPRDECGALRQYQLHQFRDGRFELRLQAASPLPETFQARVLERWRGAAQDAAVPELGFTYVEQFEKGPGGKFENFTSDFVPAPDEAAT